MNLKLSHWINCLLSGAWFVMFECMFWLVVVDNYRAGKPFYAFVGLGASVFYFMMFTHQITEVVKEK